MFFVVKVAVLLSTLSSAVCGHFSIEDDAFGEGSDIVKLKRLKNLDTGEYVEVAWNRGGRTEGLHLLDQDGKLHSTLLDNRRNATEVKSNLGFKGDLLIPYANRIKNGTYRFNGKTYYLERNEDRKQYGKQGLHGYLYKKELHVVSTEYTSKEAVLQLGYDFDGTDPGYPFNLSVVLKYMLSADGFKLTTIGSNRAVDGMPLPFMTSWHSYIRVADVSKSVVTLDRCSRWNHIDVTNNSNLYSDLIPTGLTTQYLGFDGSKPIGGTYDNPTYYDDEFKAIATVDKCPHLEVSVYDPVEKATSVLWMDSNFRWVQLFTGGPTALSLKDQGVAVEAMSGEMDSWNNMQGVKVLQAGEEFVGSFGVYLQKQEGYLRAPYRFLRI